MASPKTFDGVVASQVITDEGYIRTFDKNDRPCYDGTLRTRVVLVHDLRVYGKGLHIGQLGWTAPETTDGYKAVRVEFPDGQRLLIRTFAMERVVPERAEEISQVLIRKYRNTRFDADAILAERCRQQWIDDYYGKYVSLAEMTTDGEGDQELYAFTFPSLRELADLRGDKQYPVKIGYAKSADAGAIGRIRQQITERAAYPEKPLLLHVQRTWDGRNLETQVHRSLRTLNRKVVHSLGKEWFLTSKDELLGILQTCSRASRNADCAVSGTDETLEEGVTGLLAQGATIEFGMDPESACVRMSIKRPGTDSETQ